MKTKAQGYWFAGDYVENIKATVKFERGTQLMCLTSASYLPLMETSLFLIKKLGIFHSLFSR